MLILFTIENEICMGLYHTIIFTVENTEIQIIIFPNAYTCRIVLAQF